MKHYLLALTMVIVVFATCKAQACDYGDVIRPDVIYYEYMPINSVDAGGGIVVYTLKNNKGEYPQFVIITVEKMKIKKAYIDPDGVTKYITNELETISSYWYLNMEYKLEFYGFTKTGHYGKLEFSDKEEKQITNALLKLQGITSI